MSHYAAYSKVRSDSHPWPFSKSISFTWGLCHEIDYPPEPAYPGDTLFLSPSTPHLVKSQPMDKKFSGVARQICARGRIMKLAPLHGLFVDIPNTSIGILECKFNKMKYFKAD